MSWSVSAVGKPAAVKAALQPQFQYAKGSTSHIAHEQASVCSVEEIVNGQLDFMASHAPTTPVTVKASGSASVAPKDASWESYTQIALEVIPINGFIE